mmetsp:Transcript_26726/g.37237  ORF Transcript_26726/g.37237 Transcript_26726/m.37237 type:complete len:142 (-) Transcript_26726:59-484(-)
MRKKKIVMPIHGIHTAAKNGDLKAVEQYLDQGVSPDIQEDSNWTPLHYAAWMNRIEVGQLLLERGANCDPKSKKDRTPLQRAVVWGHSDFVSLLLHHGADPYWKNDEGVDSFDHAEEKNRKDILALLQGNIGGSIKPALRD